MMLKALFYLFAITCAFALGAFSVLGVDALRQQGSGTGSSQALEFPAVTSNKDEVSSDLAKIAPPAPSPDITYAPNSFASAVKLAAPAVVTIYTSRVERESNPSPFFSLPFDDPFFEDFFGPNTRDPADSKTLRSLGSGVVVDETGLIVTNHHVTSYADYIFVNLPDGRYSRASIVGGDPETDLVLLQAEDTDFEAWPVITFGDDLNIEVGDWVLAIGNPFSVGQTVTQGIISAVGRSNVGVTTYENFIQTDAAINPGNSGGALVNAKGELLGINTAIFSRSGGSHGIGFAIPVTTVLKIIEQIRTSGQVSRGWMGLYLRDVYPNEDELNVLSDQRNVFVAGVYENGPADEAGVLSGDQIISIDGEVFVDSQSLSVYIADQAPGDAIILNIKRGTEELDLLLSLGTRPPQNSR